MTLALIGLILFLLSPIVIGSGLAWLRIREERTIAPSTTGPGARRWRDPRRKALPPAA